MNIAESTSLFRAFRSSYSLSGRIFVTVTFQLSSNIKEEIKITRWNGKNATFTKDQRYDHDEAMYFDVLVDILTPSHRMSVKITKMDENERFELLELVVTSCRKRPSSQWTRRGRRTDLFASSCCELHKLQNTSGAVVRYLYGASFHAIPL